MMKNNIRLIQMIKKNLIALGLFTIMGVTQLNAAQPNQLLSDKVAQAEFKKISLNKALPRWTKQEGTTSATKTVNIGNKSYEIFNVCQPHNCFAEQVVVAYAPSTKETSAVYSKFNEKMGTQQLTWMTNQAEISIEVKTVLLSSLTGALENYPQKFNF